MCLFSGETYFLIIIFLTQIFKLKMRIYMYNYNFVECPFCYLAGASLVWICLITFSWSLMRTLQWASYRENISGLCETTERISVLFSVADRRRAGLAKWRYNVSLTINHYLRVFSLKYSRVVDAMVLNYKAQ